MKLPELRFLYVLTAMSPALLTGCGELPDLEGRSISTAVQNTADTRLGKVIEPLVQAHPGKSGVVPVRDGRDAFAARKLLADAAERTLDVQYYIWHNDMSGTLLFEALHRAADRGVRVRLLLDDNNTTNLDTVLAALDAHPNIQVRLFNPFIHRRWRFLDYLTDFERLNRRMHNKSFTADNQVTIIGGRNVGDEYFDAGQNVLFVDLDVLAIGPVVKEVSNDFDRYWASGSSYPAARVLTPVSAATIAALAAVASLIKHDPHALAYIQALARQPFVRALLAGRLPFEWAATRMVSDDPAKGLDRAVDDALLWPWLKRLLGGPTHELELVSPYFVPGAAGVEFFTALAKQGVKITVLTNSLEATDVAAVHAGYAKRRKPLLKAGIALFEMKLTSSSPSVRDRGLTGSSGSSLHAKTFSVDRSHVFIGSFNFDPRSASLNTEMGFVIDSPVLARQIADAFADGLLARTYKVRLSSDGALQWVERRGGKTIVHDEEPGAGFWRRFGVFILSRLPIEWLL
jgi:putative cardiolipin synthase